MEKKMKAKVSFGIVNCNRLYYLKSCLESLLICTEDYDDKEIIIVDNASVEEGTEDYLAEKEKQGIRVYRQKERDPANEFARALNLIVEETSGRFVCPLQGDMQFIVKGGWLKEYVDFAEKYEANIGGIGFDAQRRVRIARHAPFGAMDENMSPDEFHFFADIKRNPVQGAADCFYTRKMLEKIYPWHIKNVNFEGEQDSETHMLNKVKSLHESGQINNVYTFVPKIPVSAAICTDARGTMGRVRGNKRYGDYWEAKSNNLYYNLIDYDEAIRMQNENGGMPLPIERMAVGNGWEVPIDEMGAWKKNPIRPETATDSDFVILY